MKNDLIKYLSLYKELYSDEIYFDQRKQKIISEDSNELKLANYLDSIKDCMECSLGKTRNKIVLGMGNPSADIVFVGEAPGKEEDIQGFPFVGRSGKLCSVSGLHGPIICLAPYLVNRGNITRQRVFQWACCQASFIVKWRQVSKYAPSFKGVSVESPQESIRNDNWQT